MRGATPAARRRYAPAIGAPNVATMHRPQKPSRAVLRYRHPSAPLSVRSMPACRDVRDCALIPRMRTCGAAMTRCTDCLSLRFISPPRAARGSVRLRGLPWFHPRRA